MLDQGMKSPGGLAEIKNIMQEHRHVIVEITDHRPAGDIQFQFISSCFRRSDTFVVQWKMPLMVVDRQILHRCLDLQFVQIRS